MIYKNTAHFVFDFTPDWNIFAFNAGWNVYVT